MTKIRTLLFLTHLWEWQRSTCQFKRLLTGSLCKRTKTFQKLATLACVPCESRTASARSCVGARPGNQQLQHCWPWQSKMSSAVDLDAEWERLSDCSVLTRRRVSRYVRVVLHLSAAVVRSGMRVDLRVLGFVAGIVADRR